MVIEMIHVGKALLNVFFKSNECVTSIVVFSQCPQLWRRLCLSSISIPLYLLREDESKHQAVYIISHASAHRLSYTSTKNESIIYGPIMPHSSELPSFIMIALYFFI